MSKTYKSIFPTFEEIKNGQVEIVERTYFKTVNGEKRQYSKLSLELIIANCHFAPLFDRVLILRDRSGKRIAFQPITAGKTWRLCFAYNAAGWNECISIIKQELTAYKRMIRNIVNEEDI